MWARLKSSLRKSELLGDTALHQTWSIDAHVIDHIMQPSRPLCIMITVLLQMALVQVLMALRQEVTALTPLSEWQCGKVVPFQLAVFVYDGIQHGL